MDSILNSFNDGLISSALMQAQKKLKAQPHNESLRFLLVQLYLLNHQYEKAVVHLTILEKSTAHNMQSAFAIHCYQKITSALYSRSCLFTENKMMDIDASTLTADALETLLHRLVGREDNDDIELEERAAMPLTLVKIDGEQLTGEGLDPDDLLYGFVELVSQQGVYRLCSINDIESITFEAPSKPLDCLLQRVQLTWKKTPKDAQQTETLLHINHYPFTNDGNIDLNGTDWDAERIKNRVIGLGQKVICINEEIIPMSQLKQLRFG